MLNDMEPRQVRIIIGDWGMTIEGERVSVSFGFFVNMGLGFAYLPTAKALGIFLTIFGIVIRWADDEAPEDVPEIEGVPV